MSLRVCLPVVICTLFGSVLPASAQIYTWRDANGNLVLSDRRPTTASASVRSYEVPKTQSIRATRYVAAERSRPFEDVILVHAREQDQERRHKRAAADAGHSDDDTNQKSRSRIEEVHVAPRRMLRCIVDGHL